MFSKRKGLYTHFVDSLPLNWIGKWSYKTLGKLLWEIQVLIPMVGEKKTINSRTWGRIRPSEKTLCVVLVEVVFKMCKWQQCSYYFIAWYLIIVLLCWIMGFWRRGVLQLWEYAVHAGGFAEQVKVWLSSYNFKAYLVFVLLRILKLSNIIFRKCWNGLRNCLEM